MKRSVVFVWPGAICALLLGAISVTDAVAREWTSGNGKFSLEAEYVALKDGKVVLEKPDGSYLAVPLDKLSDEDRVFVAEQAGIDLPEEDAAVEEEASVGQPRAAKVIKLKGSKPGDPPGEVRKFTDILWTVHGLAFSPNGAFLAAGKLDSAVMVFDVDRGVLAVQRERLEELGQVEVCVFSPSGKHLLTGGYSGLISIWNVAKDGQISAAGQFAGHTEEIKALAVSPDGRFAASGGRDKRVRYWQISNGKEIAMFAGFKDAVKACAFSKDGRSILATDGATLLTFQIKTEKTSSNKLTDFGNSGQFAAFSPDGKWVAAGDGSNVRVWDLKTNQEMPQLQAGDLQWSGVFTPDGTRLITGGLDVANVFDVKSGKRLAALKIEGGGYVKALAASPDNEHIAASGRRNIQVLRIPRD